MAGIPASMGREGNVPLSLPPPTAPGLRLPSLLAMVCADTGHPCWAQVLMGSAGFPVSSQLLLTKFQEMFHIECYILSLVSVQEVNPPEREKQGVKRKRKIEAYSVDLLHTVSTVCFKTMKE